MSTPRMASHSTPLSKNVSVHEASSKRRAADIPVRQLLTGVLTDCLRRYDVVNRGFSGYNTSQALKIFEHLFPEPGPGTPKMEYLVSPPPLLCGMPACLPAPNG